MVADDFDIEHVHQLVDGALAAPSTPAGGPGLAAQQVSLLGIFYSALDEGGVTIDARNRVMSRLREELSHWEASPSLGSLAKTVKSCRLCPDAAPGSGQMLMGNTKNPEWVFVCESVNDNLASLREWLTRMGFDLSRVGVTFVTRCRFGGKPDAAAVSNCGGYLLEEIHCYQPRIVVPVGATAARVLLGDDVSISKMHGQSYWIDELHVVPLLSPAYAERSNQLAGLQRDLEFILSVA